MNPMSLIVLPLRAGYHVARTAVDVATGAARLVGIGGDGNDFEPAPVPTEQAERKAPPARPPQRRPAAGSAGSDRPRGAAGPRAKPKPKPTAEPKPKASPSGAPTPGPGAEPAGALKPPPDPTPAAEAAPPTVEPAVPEPPAGAPEPTPAAEAAPPAVEPAPPAGATGQPETDDATLAHRVESEIFREAGAPKGSVDVNAAAGTVWLRGQAQSVEQIEELVRRTLRVRGVKRVENLLHTPGSPAPEPSPAGREPIRTRANGNGNAAA